MQVLGAALKLLLGTAQDQVAVYFIAESTHAFPGARVWLPHRSGGEESFDSSSLSLPQVNKCSHFFQLKNISFCGYHPKNNK